MGFVIKEGKVIKAKKVILNKKDRKDILTQTQEQKEILEKAKKRKYQ